MVCSFTLDLDRFFRGLLIQFNANQPQLNIFLYMDIQPFKVYLN